MEFNKISESEFSKTINDFIKIDPSQIQNNLLEHAANFAWFAVLHSKAQSKRERLKFELKVLEAELDKNIRAQAYELGKKITEKEIEMKIMSNPSYKEKMSDFLTAREEEDLLDAIVQAFIQRKDMLVSFVSLQKEELKAGISLKE